MPLSQEVHKPVSFETFRRWDSGSETHHKTYTYSHAQHKSWRSGSVPSDGHKPTEYLAHRYECEPAQVYLEGTRKRTYYQRKWQWYTPITKGEMHMTAVWYGTLDGYPDNTEFPSWTESAAITKALNKCTNDGLALGQYLGELGTSGRMLIESVATVRAAYAAARKGRFGKVARILGVSRIRNLPKSTASAWLAYKFGWLPYLQDSYNLSKGIVDALNRPNTGNCKVTVLADKQITPEGGTYTTEFVNKRKGTEVGISYRVGNSTLAGLNSLGLLNPLSLAWELLPMSFVLDWFVPIGSVLSALSAPIGLKFDHGYSTRFAYGQGPIIRGESIYHVNTFGMHRKVLDDWPKPKLWFNLDLNLNQAAVLAALIAQRKG